MSCCFHIFQFTAPYDSFFTVLKIMHALQSATISSLIGLFLLTSPKKIFYFKKCGEIFLHFNILAKIDIFPQYLTKILKSSCVTISQLTYYANVCLLKPINSHVVCITAFVLWQSIWHNWLHYGTTRSKLEWLKIFPLELSEDFCCIQELSYSARWVPRKDNFWCNIFLTCD